MYPRRYYPTRYYAKRYFPLRVPASASVPGFYPTRYFPKRYYPHRYYPHLSAESSDAPTVFASIAILIGPDPYRSTAEPM